MTSSVPVLLIPSFILLAGVANDLWARKVKNWIVVACAVLAFATSLTLGGWSQVAEGGLGLLTALLLTLPLVLFGALGAGDMKIFMAFGLAVDSHTVLTVAVGSLFWGALLGLSRSVVQGQGLVLLKNTAGIFYSPWKADAVLYHKVPYTVALFLGWTTFLALETYGVSL